MMTISLFLLLCLIAILVLGFSYRGSGRTIGPQRRMLYLVIWTGIGLAGLWTINRYTYPEDKINVFGNSDYHVLEHLGYQFGDSLTLADLSHPENALWDKVEGNALLVTGEQYRIELDSFFQPFFLREKAKGGFRLKFWTSQYADVLQNDFYPGLDARDGLEIRMGDSLLAAIEISPYDRGDTLRYLVKLEEGKEARLSDFNSKIKKGYPLADLLRYTPGWQEHDSLLRLFEGAWLIRTIQNDEESPLTFFPSRALQLLPGLRVTAGGKTVVPAKAEARKDVEIASGQKFYIGLGMDHSQEMRLEPQGRRHRIRFAFPEKFRLARKEDNQLFLCSDLRDVAQNVIQGGFLYSVFQEEDNDFHVNATLRYRHGTSRERLSMQVNDHYSPEKQSSSLVEGGEEFALRARDRKSDLRWIMKLTDLRASNPVGRGHLFAFVIGYILLVLLTMAWIGDRRLGAVEMSLYVLVFGFLLVRLLLQWRMGVFPPVDDAGPNTWAALRSMSHFNRTVFLTLAFFLVRWMLNSETDHLPDRLNEAWMAFRKRMEGWKRIPAQLGSSGLVLRIKNSLQPLLRRFDLEDFQWRKYLETGSFRKFMLAYLLAWGVLFILARLVEGLDVQQLVRFANIAFPMSLFFFTEYTVDQHRSEEHHRFGGLNPYSLFNTTLILAFLAVSDAGFGIIFLLFSLLFQVYRIVMRPRRKTRRKTSDYWWAPAALGGLVFAAVIFGADEFIHFVFARRGLFYWLVLVPSLLAWTMYFGAFALRRREEKVRKKWLGVLGGGMLLLLLAGNGLVKQQIEDFSYVKYRAAIQTGSPDQIIEKEQFATGRVGQIMRAAQNQWLINTYLREMEPEEGRESSYFNLRPHFNKGSSYTTQTTDLVVTRYIISEHGVSVVILLLCLLLAVTGLYSFRVDLAGKHRFVPFGMLLLVFTTALFIWLTATNRFIFFGQDFPLISLTSIFTLVFTLGLVLVVMVSVPENTGKKSIGTSNRPSIWLTASPLLALILMGVLLQQSRRELNEENFDFNLSLDQARADFNDLNDEFRTFQNTIPTDLPADSVLALFHATGQDNLDSSQVFTRTLYEHFVLKEKDKMNPDHLLYLVQRPDAGRVKYLFALNPTYYLVRPPRRSRKDWTGNLLAAQEMDGGVYLVGQEGERLLIPGDSAMAGLEERLPDHLDQVRMAVVPASWMASGRPAVLVWAGTAGEDAPDFTLTDGSDGDRETQPGYADPAVRMRSGEVLSLHGPSNRSLRFRYDEDYKEFLAKNIWLNGDQRLFFPLGDQLLWAYYYAGAVRHARGGTEARHENERVSIDFSLTRGIHHIAEKSFRKYNWKRQRLGVVVLDGEGRIRSLSDYKGSEETIDPNDIDEIHEKNREFHLRRNNHDERQAFGNVNLLKLTHGAASSVKPLIYAAVTSQYDLGWRQMRTVGIPQSQRDNIQDPKTKVLHYYGGRKVEIGWGGIGEADFDPKSAREYLTYSKNLYHSMVIFLGSYRREQLRNNLFASRDSDRKTVFMPAWSREDSVDFPVVDLGRGPWTIRKEGWPGTDAKQRTFFGDDGSLLAEGLSSNLKLPTYPIRTGDRTRRDYLNIDREGSGIYEGADPGSRLYAYPELAHFYQSDRALRPENPLWFIQGMRQPTAGNDPMVLTPLKIAEMAGKLFSQNRDYRTTLSDLDDAGSNRAGWRVDSSWGNSGYHEFLRDVVFASMREVMISGTAGQFGRRLRKGSPYYYYGKTGTIGDADDDDTSPDKLMLLVISKGDVTTMSPAELAANKFYVLYFTGLEMYDQNNMDRVWDLYTEVVRETERSYLFQSYMK